MEKRPRGVERGGRWRGWADRPAPGPERGAWWFLFFTGCLPGCPRTLLPNHCLVHPPYAASEWHLSGGKLGEKADYGGGQTACLFPLHLVRVLAATRDVTFTPNSAQIPSGISTPYVCPPRPFLPGLGGSGAPREGIGRWVRVSREAKATVGIVSHCSLPPPSPP